MSGKLVLTATVLGSAMAFIDGTAVNVALPVMQRELHASSQAMQWVIEGYALFLGALILTGGALGDLYGRKRFFLTGIAVFAVASIGCALAPTVEALIAVRCLQGIGAALCVPQSLAILNACFAGVERGRAIGTWSAFASLTAAGGPVLGGWFAQHASWRDVFLINVPLAAVVLAIAPRGVPESRDDARPRRLDACGAALATIALGAITYGLIALQGGGRPGFGVATLAGGTALLAAFVAVEAREPSPMLPLRLFRSRTFAATNAYTLFLYAALGGALYFLPFVLIDVQRYTPTAAGAALLPFVALQVAFARWSGGLAARIGARVPLIAGALLAAASFVAFALPGIGGTYWATYFPGAVLLGCAGVLFVAPLTTAVFAAVDVEESGIASGVNNAVSRIAGLVAVAGFGIVLTAFAPAGTREHDPSALLHGARAVMLASAATCLVAAAIAALRVR